MGEALECVDGYGLGDTLSSGPSGNLKPAHACGSGMHNARSMILQHHVTLSSFDRLCTLSRSLYCVMQEIVLSVLADTACGMEFIHGNNIM